MSDTPIYDQVITDMTAYKLSIERRTIEAIGDEIRLAHPVGKKRTKQTAQILDLLEKLRKTGIR